MKWSERKTSSSSSYISFPFLLLYLSFFHHYLICCCSCFPVFNFLSLALLSFHPCFFSVFPPPPHPPPALHRSPHVGVISCFSPQCFLPLMLFHIWPSLSVPKILYKFFIILLFTCIAQVKEPYELSEVSGYWFLHTSAYNRLYQYIIRETVLWLSVEGCWSLQINKYQSPLLECIYRVSFHTIQHYSPGTMIFCTNNQQLPQLPWAVTWCCYLI